MPAQTVTGNTKYYGQNDTAPDFVNTLYDEDGVTPLDLTGAEVFLTMAWTRYSHYYAPGRTQVDRAACVIQGDPTLGVVAWTPVGGDMAFIGNFDISYEIKYGDGRVRTSPLPTYKHIIVRAAPGGDREPLT